MEKIEVPSFEDLVVLVLVNGKVYLAHGDANQTTKGVIVTREPKNVVYVDKASGVSWLKDIVCKGQTLEEYREEAIAWVLDQLSEPESSRLPEEEISSDVVVSPPKGDVSASITLPVSSSAEAPSSTL